MREQTVAAVLAAVQDVHQVGVAISVREKVVAQQIDLDERLFFGHRRELGLLAAHDLVVGQLVHEAIEIQLALGMSILVGEIDDALGGADLLVQYAGLVLAQLAGDLGGGHVDGGVHVLFAFLHTHDMALDANGDLADGRQRVRRILLGVQDNFRGNGVGVHSLDRVTDLLLSILTKGVGDGHFASGHGDRHGSTSLIRGLQIRLEGLRCVGLASCATKARRREGCQPEKTA